MKKHIIENLCLSIAVGGLRAIAEVQPHRSKYQGGCERLADKILKHGRSLRGVSKEEIEILKKCIIVSGEFMDTLQTENSNHTLLNLIVFCMEEIKENLHRADFDHMNRLFEMFEGSDCHEDVMLGRRVYERLMAEVQILFAMEEINGH